MSQRFSAGPGVTHERLDDEVLAVHLVTGMYYSMIGTAADVWQSVVAGVSLSDVAAALAAATGADQSTITADLQTFVDALLADALVVAGDGAVDALPIVTVDRYAGPRLERHGDLQDLLLIDPIHDVSDQGWPARVSE